MSRARVVIVGGGFAGAFLAQTLGRKHRRLADVTLIARENFLLFYPLLVEAGTGSLEPRHVVVSLRKLLPRTHLILGDVVGADVGKRTVEYRPEGARGTQTIACDHLVLAMGSTTRRPAIPGLARHAYELKSMADAVGLRDRAIRMLEIASELEDPAEKRAALHFVIAGGSFTGTELAGEFHAYLRRASRQYTGVRAGDCHVTLVELGDRILPALSDSLSAYASKKLAKRGVRILTKTGLEGVGDDFALLSDGTRLAARTTVWCAGVAPPPLNEKIAVPADDGWIACEPTLQVKGLPNVWAIGDCAFNPGPDGKPYPATAQHAVRQGKWLARNLARVLRGKQAEPCRISSFGSIAPLGCRTAVAQVLGLKVSGLFAWWLFRSVYLLKMPGLGRKLRVAIDWTLDLLFPPDVVQMGIAHPQPEPAPDD